MTPTNPQFRILVAVDAASQLSNPWPPTLEMVATLARLKSRSAVTYHLPALKVGGWVETGPHNRGLRLTAAGRRALRSGKVKP